MPNPEADGHGTKRWYFNGLLHRTDGPAVVYSDGSKQWFLNDRLHRIDGPASAWSDGSNYWYLHGKALTEEQHRLATVLYRLANA